MRTFGNIFAVVQLSAVLAVLGVALGIEATARDSVVQDPVQDIGRDAAGQAIYREQCAMCHEAPATRAPAQSVLRQMSPEGIIRALESGAMKEQGSRLSQKDRADVALFLTGKAVGAVTANASAGVCATSNPLGDISRTPHWNGWGTDVSNTRFQSAAQAGISTTNLPHLKLRWAFGFSGSIVANAQPTIAGGRVFVGSAGRAVYSLDARSGCIIWKFEPDAPVRAAITIGPGSTSGKQVAYFGDGRAYVYAVDASTGQLIWKTRADDTIVSRITGAPQLYRDKVYVAISVVEDGLTVNPKYECCKFRASVVAIDAATGKQAWKTYVIAEEAKPAGKNKIGVQQWGPSGASIWSAPTIDPKLNAVYVGTGDNHSKPETDTSDSIIAMDMTSGQILWSKQLTPHDTFNVSCVRADRTNCPEPAGPDADFGSSAILVNMPGGRRALLCGQKSAVMHALDPDRKGEIIWETRIGRGGPLGGIQWGSAADAENVYVPLSDIAFIQGSEPGGRLVADPKVGGGIFALRIKDGSKVWNAAPPSCGDRQSCSPAQSAAATVIPGVVFSGSVDGHLRGYSTKDGRVLWDYNTAHDYQAVNGVAAKGGSLDGPGPVVAGGWLFVNSGYGYWGGLPGNVLLAFSVDDQ